MKLLTTICALFMFGSCTGWVIELFYRRAAHGKWINPGFLTGPCLPLYGNGVLLLYGFCSLDWSFIPSPTWQKVVLIAALAVALTGIEFLAGEIFTRIFHVKLWDYSTRWGNVDGVICPLFSLIWAAVGALYVLLLHPHLAGFVAWLAENPIYNFFSGIYVGIFVVDIGYSFHVVSKIREVAKERQILVRYENFKLSIARHREALRQKRNFVFPFHSRGGLLKELEQYIRGERGEREDKSASASASAGQIPETQDK